jgi:hypothetical protein
MGNINVSGRMARKSVVKDMNGNIINLIDETDGGWIIRNRQVVNPEKFEKMQAAGVPATENVPHQTWWAQARKIVKIHESSIAALPCDCHQS